MTQAIELNSVRRGYDPREFTLVAGGRRGPALRLRHRARARDPARARAAAPRDHRGDRPPRHRPPARVRRHRAARAEEPRPRRGSSARFDELVGQAVAQLDADGVPEERRLVRRLADCRYAGQGYEVRTEVPAGRVDDAWVEELRSASTRAHEAEYGHRFDADDRDRQRPRRRDRPGRRAPAARARARRRRSVARRGRSSARSCSTSTARRAQLRRRSTSAICCAPATGSTARRSSSSTTRRRSIPPGLAAEIDRHGNIVIDCTRRRARRAPARGGRARDADPHARDRRRLRVDREGDGGRPLPHVATRRSSASRRTSARASSTATATSSPSPTRRRCSWARCRRS